MSIAALDSRRYPPSLDVQAALVHIIAEAEAAAKSVQRSDPCRAAVLALGRAIEPAGPDAVARANEVLPYVLRQLVTLGYYSGLRDSCEHLANYRPSVVQWVARQLATPDDPSATESVQ